MNNLILAKTILLENKYSIVVVKNNEIVDTSYERGLKPLLNLYEEKSDLLEGAFVADKVIGKAAALILISAGIKELYAGLISENAIEILDKAPIRYEYEVKTKEIRNRDNTGMCPMEELALASDTAEEFIGKFKEKINK